MTRWLELTVTFGDAILAVVHVPPDEGRALAAAVPALRGGPLDLRAEATPAGALLIGHAGEVVAAVAQGSTWTAAAGAVGLRAGFVDAPPALPRRVRSRVGAGGTMVALAALAVALVGRAPTSSPVPDSPRWVALDLSHPAVQALLARRAATPPAAVAEVAGQVDATPSADAIAEAVQAVLGGGPSGRAARASPAASPPAATQRPLDAEPAPGALPDGSPGPSHAGPAEPPRAPTPAAPAAAAAGPAAPAAAVPAQQSPGVPAPAPASSVAPASATASAPGADAARAAAVRSNTARVFDCYAQHGRTPSAALSACLDDARRGLTAVPRGDTDVAPPPFGGPVVVVAPELRHADRVERAAPIAFGVGAP